MVDPARWLRCVALLALVFASGCEYNVVPLKGQEGRTLVYAAIGRQGAPNAGIIVTSIGAVVIDPPLSPELGERLNTDALRRSKTFWDEKHRGAGQPSGPPPVLYVLNTTYRASHTFGNQAFKATAEIISSTKAAAHMADLLEGRKMRELLQSEFKVPGLERHGLTGATISFDGALTIHSPEVEIRMISVGDCVGEGDAVVFLPQQKILFAGDFVLAGFVPYYRGRTPTARAWIAQLKKFEELLPDDIVVVPGHGPQGGKELLKQQREFLEALIAAVKTAVLAKKTVEQAVQEVKLPNFARWQGYSDWLGENVRLVFQELTQSGGNETGSSGGATMATPSGVEDADHYRGL